MTDPRVLLVTRRFWPLVGGAEAAMANLAMELVRRGVETQIVTARWQPRWPRQLQHRGVPVARLAQSRARFWGTLWYMWRLSRWMIAHRQLYDLVYVSMLKHCAYVAVGAGRRTLAPVVVRAEGAGVTGDCFWQLDAHFGRRIKRRVQHADAFVAPSPAIEQELIAAGYDRQRIHRIPNGVPIPPPRGLSRRREARTSLAALEPAFVLPDDAPLAVYAGRLHSSKGLETLVRAWQIIEAKHRGAGLWLVGEGPLRASLAELASDLGLASSMVLTGAFDAVDELLAAADLFVLPSLEEGMSLALLEAMAAGLPVVASDIPGNRDVVDHGVHCLLVAPGDVGALAEAVGYLFDHESLAAHLGAHGRDRVKREFSISRTAEMHLALFQQLTGVRPSPL